MNNTSTTSLTENASIFNHETRPNPTNYKGLSGMKYNDYVSNELALLNLDAEESVLGGLLLDPEAMLRVERLLKPQDFYVVSHQLIYKRMQELYAQRGVNDFLSLQSHLETKKELEKIGGLAKLTQLVDKVISTVYIDKHAELIVEKSVQRQIRHLGHEISSLGQNYQSEYCRDSQGNGTKNTLKDRLSLLLSNVEQKVFELTRSEYRTDLTEDPETRTAHNIVNKIKYIENTVNDLVVKRYKLIALAKQYKISAKELEGLYLAHLTQRENQPIETLANLRKKYGDNVDEWFVQGVIPKGCVTLLHSLGGVGKTRLAYDLIYAMVTGTSWGSQFPVTAPTRRCLIVQTDESRNDMIRSLNSRGFTDEMPVFVKTNWSFEHIADLRREIIENNIEMVFIDSLTTVCKNSVVSENDTEYARPILQLRDLAEELNISIVLNHHSNSGGKSRGTKAIYNSVSQVLCLRFPSDESKSSCPNRLLMFEKTRMRRPTEYKLAFNMNEETGQWSWICEGENIKNNEQEETITEIVINFLAENRNKCFSAKEIADICKLAVNTVRKIMFKLSELDKLVGRIQSKRKGKPWLHFLKWEIESSPGKDDSSDQKPNTVESPPPKQEEIVLEADTLELQEIEEKLEDKEQIPDLPDPQTLPDLPDLREVDQLEVSQEESFPLPDLHSPRIEKISESLEEKNRGSGITKKKVNSETIVESVIKPDLLPDPVTDLLSDPQKKDQKRGSVKVSNIQSQDIYVRYVGTDPELIKICSVSKDIKILGKIDDQGMCFIWSDNWSQPTRVYWGDLVEPETT